MNERIYTTDKRPQQYMYIKGGRAPNGHIIASKMHGLLADEIDNWRYRQQERHARRRTRVWRAPK